MLSADARTSPPLVNVSVAFGWILVVKHGAQPTQEISVDEFAGSFPPEIRIVKFVVPVELVKVSGEFFRRSEIVHVNVRVLRRTFGVVFGMSAHNDRKDVSSGSETGDKRIGKRNFLFERKADETHPRPLTNNFSVM